MRLRSMACVISDLGAVWNSASIWGAVVCAIAGKPATIANPSATTQPPLAAARALREGRALPAADGNNRN
jgi:hypothetical protein